MLTPPEYQTPHAEPKQCYIVVQLSGRWLVRCHKWPNRSLDDGGAYRLLPAREPTWVPRNA